MAEILKERRNHYVGQTSRQLRDGFGVYVYGNKFFRYEGEWVKGKKHGHGKLIMADGSYYEGEFKNGEIEGHGFRRWQHNGNSYSGEFSKGEMHGHGVMNYADGSQYQGEFYWNQRHGNGILRDKEGNEYEGSWYKNKQHGQGILTFSTGDEYEGEWVEGYRHGHGELNCVDGTIYEGQWRADTFSGQGAMVHASGFIYEGLWINGQPEVEAAEIVVKLTPGQKFIEVPQGKKFSLCLQLLDSNKEEMTGERGREFQIMAGYRYSQSPRAMQSQSLLELIEDIEAKPISTPFGYDVLPYPIVEVGKDYDDTEVVPALKKKSSPGTSRIFGGEAIPESREMIHETEKPDSNHVENPDDVENSSTLSGSKYTSSDMHLELSAEVVADDVEVPLSRLLPPPAPQRSSATGAFEFHDLLLPCAPPNYRPFLQEDEVHNTVPRTPTGSTSSLRRGPGVASVSSSSIRSDKSKRSKGSRTASAQSTTSTGGPEKGTKGKSKHSDSEEKCAKTGKVSPGKKGKESKGKKGKKGHSPQMKKESSPSISPDREEETGSPLSPSVAVQDLVAREGDYVLIVQEATQPPFLGKHLPPAFVVVKVTPAKKPASKKTAKKSKE